MQHDGVELHLSEMKAMKGLLARKKAEFAILRHADEFSGVLINVGGSL